MLSLATSRPKKPSARPDPNIRSGFREIAGKAASLFARIMLQCRARLWPETADPECPLFRRYRRESGHDLDIAERAFLTRSGLSTLIPSAGRPTVFQPPPD